MEKHYGNKKSLENTIPICHRAKHLVFALQWVIPFAFLLSLKVNAGENCPTSHHARKQQAESWNPACYSLFDYRGTDITLTGLLKGAPTDCRALPSSLVFGLLRPSSHIPSKWQNPDSNQSLLHNSTAYKMSICTPPPLPTDTNIPILDCIKPDPKDLLT